MENPSRRTALSGPTLIRVLSRVTDMDAAEPAHSVAQRLGEWLGLTDAIALSAALGGEPAATSRSQAGDDADGPDDARAQASGLRQSLTTAIIGDAAFVRVRTRGNRQAAHATADAGTAADYGFFRQRYLALQQRMETDIGATRRQLRAALAARAPSQASLAAVDAAMERALGVREQALLAALPALLAGHFERLCESAQAVPAGVAGEPRAVVSHAWLEAFREDMRNVLLAELDLRLQPVEGLCAALRTS